MDNAFSAIANLRLPTPSRVLPSSWCPDKDLLLIVTSASGRSKLGLWKMQGHKKWEVDIEGAETIVDLAWNPDGTIIAVVHDPPAVTLHSVQDGTEERKLTLATPPLTSDQKQKLRNVWWVKEHKKEEKNKLPDILKRNNDITGSAHSFLKAQPLLDPLVDQTQTSATPQIFAFQGLHPRSKATSKPSYISTWPSLTQDLLAASIKSARHGINESRPGEEHDGVDDTNVNSLLIISDNAGNLYYFLDGSYPLGVLPCKPGFTVNSLYMDQTAQCFVHLQKSDAAVTASDIYPSVFRLPTLQSRSLRDVGRVSSSTKELVWYAIRVVTEMREAWFGSDTQSGARELGPKWVRALESRQREQFGQQDPNGLLELTLLLVTGRPSDSLHDFLGSGDQMSDRGLQKWETTVAEALVKIRDHSEKRLIPACQRIHLLLQEVQGWSHLAPYAAFQFQKEEITRCLETASRIIICSCWLAATTRRELARFREFILWLKYETTRAHTQDPNNLPPPLHDLLEVNDYLMSGLVVSSIDKWFMGPLPSFGLSDLGIADSPSLEETIRLAQEILQPPDQLVWPPDVKHRDLTRLDRNLDALIQDLATHCHQVFTEASQATCRSVIVLSAPRGEDDKLGRLPTCDPHFTRERTVSAPDAGDGFLQYLAIRATHNNGMDYLCLFQMHHMHHGGSKTAGPAQASVALLECSLLGADGEVAAVEVLDADFFDGELLVLVYRIRDRAGPSFIATAAYKDVGYQDVDLMSYVNASSREEFVAGVFQGLGNGQLGAIQLPIKQSRVLGGCREGKATLAVNGRVGRRVACVLDGTGQTLEILDMEGEGEGEEEEEGEEGEEMATAEEVG